MYFVFLSEFLIILLLIALLITIFFHFILPGHQTLFFHLLANGSLVSELLEPFYLEKEGAIHESTKSDLQLTPVRVKLHSAHQHVQIHVLEVLFFF